MENDTDMIKITIRLPRGLARQAKLHAIALDDDLQDLVARVLREYLTREPIPASLAHLLRRGPQNRGK